MLHTPEKLDWPSPPRTLRPSADLWQMARMALRGARIALRSLVVVATLPVTMPSLIIIWAVLTLASYDAVSNGHYTFRTTCQMAKEWLLA